MADFLDKILEYKRDVVKKKENYYRTLKENIADEKLTRYGLFKDLISKPGQINLIAEIKKASPSRGLIRSRFDIMTLADIYVKNGAAAISILTEDKYFLGKPTYIGMVSEQFSIPVLTKDFIIDPGQIYETYSFGTSAILLIVAILSDEELKQLMDTASKFDLDCLVEVHNEGELERALKAGAEIIGVNNRDLHTFKVDLKVSETLIPKIPDDKVIVAESGLSSHDEIVKLKELGANAVLIGEAFLREEDIASKMKEVMHGKS